MTLFLFLVWLGALHGVRRLAEREDEREAAEGRAAAQAAATESASGLRELARAIQSTAHEPDGVEKIGAAAELRNLMDAVGMTPRPESPAADPHRHSPSESRDLSKMTKSSDGDNSFK
jgi:hypothetical protein